MKKKLLSVVLAGCMLMGFNTTAFAETTVYGDGSATVPATYHADSSYMISIPESINLNDSSLTMDFSMNITDSEYIEVSLASAAVNFEHGAYNYTGYFTDGGMQLEDGAVIMTHDNSKESPSETFYYTFDGSNVHAGDYTSSVTFNFALRQN